MLGVALSPSSKHFLRESNRGLKQFLANIPEVRVAGTKGCESVFLMEGMEEEDDSDQAHVESEEEEEECDLGLPLAEIDYLDPPTNLLFSTPHQRPQDPHPSTSPGDSEEYDTPASLFGPSDW